MTKFLLSPDNPKGLKLEDALEALRGDLLERCAHIVDDRRPDAAIVLRNNVEILELLGQCLERAHDSARVLARMS